MVQPKPILLFFGNCQAQFLAAAVKYSAAAEAYYIGGDWGFLQSYRGCVADSLAQELVPQCVAERRATGQRVVLATQVGPLMNPKYVLEINPAIADTQVLFPNTSLWSMSRESFIKMFKAPYPIERIEELNREANEAAQAKSDFPVDMARFITEESRRRPLFYTGNHPSGIVYAQLLKGLIQRLASELDCSALLEVSDACSSEEVLNFHTDHPVEVKVRNAFGWDWGPEYEIFAEMLRATADARWRDLEREMPYYEALFAGNTQFWRCSALLGIVRRSDNIALPALERLIELSPGAQGPWLLYGRYLVVMRRRELAPALLERAHAFFGNTPVFQEVSGKIDVMLRGP